MKNILIGNGITIQFGGMEYTNSNIIRRALKNVSSGNFPQEIYPQEIAQWLIYLHSEVRDILAGQYDKNVFTTNDKAALEDFKIRYKGFGKNIAYDEIGFEDYFFIHNLVCAKNKIYNPDKYNTREALKVFFLDSIYNAGKILEIYINYPQKLRSFLSEFENIFTTNYDNNIETFLGKEVDYLHGAFHILDDVYNPSSFRNMLSDHPYEQAIIINGYEHLYSNALSTYSGNSKEFSISMPASANIAISKFVEGMEKKPELIPQIESWKDSDQVIVRKLYESIMLKKENPDLAFSEYYPMKKFAEITGKLYIVGLSPFNDSHIFEAINNNDKINEVIYYFFDSSEGNKAIDLFKNKIVDLSDVKKLWEDMK